MCAVASRPLNGEPTQTASSLPQSLTSYTSALTQASRASGSKGSIRILGQRQQPPPPRSGTPTPAPDQSPRVRGQIGAPPLP